MASPTWWTWLWASSGSWWWTGKPGVLQFRARKESDMTEPLNWCRRLWTPAWFPYMAQQKMCPNGVQACQEGASSIILQEAGLKIRCDIPLSISVLCQWMREKPYEPISQDIMPWDCRLSIFSSTWELFHLCILNIGFPEKIQFRGKKKSLLLKMFVNYNSMIRSPDPGYLWVLDAKALSRPGTECHNFIKQEKSNVFQKRVTYEWTCQKKRWFDQFVLNTFNS